MTIVDTKLTRRSLLAGAGGMTFCIALGSGAVRLMSQAQANALANAPVTRWVRFAPDGRITILSAGAEMGQGSMTSLPLIVAEEMDAIGRRSRSSGCRPTPRSTAIRTRS